MMIGCETAFFNLLGSTQAFIGVLLTLNVLCLFLDKSNNFIYSLLLDQNKRFIDRLIKCQNKIQNEINEFIKSKEYQNLKKIIRSRKKISKEVRVDAQMMDYNISVNILTYKTDITESYSPLERIQKYREQVLAPVFSLGFGLIVFVLDEIGRFIPVDTNAFVLAVYAFLFVAIMYWVVIWGVFLNHSSHSHASEDRRRSLVYAVNDKLGIWWGALVKYLFCGFLYWLLLKYLPWRLMNDNGLIIFNMLAMVCPITVFGGIRMWACRVKGEYSYMHVLGHLFAMLLYAAMIGGIFEFVHPVQYASIPLLINTKWLSLLIALFLLINGILLPFLFPYYRCTRIYAQKDRELKETHKKIKKQIAESSSKINAACIDIASEWFDEEV